jgi:hypothetical protein
MMCHLPDCILAIYYLCKYFEEAQVYWSCNCLEFCSVSNNCFPQDEGTSSSEMDNTECFETSSELSNSERSRPEGSKKTSSILDKKISVKKKVS